MRVLFTLFALDVYAVALLIRHRAQAQPPSAASLSFEIGVAAAALLILAALVRMWWRPTKRLRRASATASGIVIFFLALTTGAAVAEVTEAIQENVNFAIKGEEAKAFLRAHGVTLAAAPSKQELSTGEIADLALGFTARMECWK